MFKLYVEGIDHTELIKLIETNEELNLYVGTHTPRIGLLPLPEMREIIISIVGAAGWYALLKIFKNLANRKAKLNILNSDCDEIIHCMMRYEKNLNYQEQSVKKDKESAEYTLQIKESKIMRIKLTRDFKIIEEEKSE